MISDASVLRIGAVLLIIMGALIAVLVLTDGEHPIDWADLHDVNYGDDEVTR